MQQDMKNRIHSRFTFFFFINSVIRMFPKPGATGGKCIE